MLFIPNGMKRFLGAFVYALVACQIIRFFFVARILHSDWGALHIEEPVLFSYWYPTVAALAGFLGWLDRKAGLLGFTKSVARELGSRNVRVNAVTPGYIATDMTGDLTDAQKEAILRTVPLGFLGAPEDVSSLVAYLASPASRYITGQVIGVNGGMYM